MTMMYYHIKCTKKFKTSLSLTSQACNLKVIVYHKLKGEAHKLLHSSITSISPPLMQNGVQRNFFEQTSSIATSKHTTPQKQNIVKKRVTLLHLI